ncbi:WLM domain-containing protein [Cordyceps javanica]|uniref:WLM domain-containing protein n=1 Tax=Cordyceps javanica TaxID=43265 RepID=A0A545W3F9_9HYPO|nr:WLM domain-containing protein [Cordyceps javanica]TQW08518.1 WLM domain-containing protein [Cordyceps javanica]
MPVGIQRLNARRTQPNANIVFIKALPGPDSAVAENFLERIAAQCLPIMKEHHLSVVTLEEYEPNREFVGRNFNAGEVIQLVLKSARPPHRWLPFRYVQMVMMHELAHCRQMNHSRAFWAVRDGYAAAMTALWARGYTGEGLWGRGAALATGAPPPWERNAMTDEEPLPEHLCGGTYRSRRRRRRGGKRKQPPALSWKEQKERRIARKFGTNGTALGADEAEKVQLEGGKRVAAKPRVAGSARGRELRAAAALARFGKQKVEEEAGDDDAPPPVKGDDEGGEQGGDTASGSDYEGDEDEGGIVAVDRDGKMIKDKDGRAMVKVCEDEDGGGGDDPAARNERDELRRVFARPSDVKPDGDGGAVGDWPRIKDEPPETRSDGLLRGASSSSSLASAPRPLRLHDIPHIRDAVPPLPSSSKDTTAKTTKPRAAASRAKPAVTASRGSNTRPAITIHRLPVPSPQQQQQQQQQQQRRPPQPQTPAEIDDRTTAAGGVVVVGTVPTLIPCPLCSLDNDAGALRCAACANVLRPDAVQGSWACRDTGCRETGYVNAGDCGVCGLCGGQKP